MKIAIDISPLTNANAYRGVGSYTRALTKALQGGKSKFEIDLVDKTQTLLKPDLIHYPYFDLFFKTLNPPKEIPIIVTVHDLIPLKFANHYWPGFKGLIRHFAQINELKKARAIITDSYTSKQDIHQLLDIPQDKIEVVYLAADENIKPVKGENLTKVLEKYQIKKPYLLYVGDINYNKNLLALLWAFSQVDGWDLVLVAKALKNTEIREAKIIYQTIAKLGLTKRIKILTNVPIEPISDLAGIYSGSEWYIQPSLYEGFGLPVLEAMQCNVGVISSLGGSLRELVNDNNAITFNPESDEQMVQALHRAQKINKAAKDKMIEVGQKTAKNFSWEKTATETLKVYEKYIG